jgi:hypothetical protein
MFKYLKLIDFFYQTKQFNVSKDKSTFQSTIGALFSILIYTLILAYIALRFEVLISHGATSVYSVVHPRYHHQYEVLTLEKNSFAISIGGPKFAKMTKENFAKIGEFRLNSIE